MGIRHGAARKGEILAGTCIVLGLALLPAACASTGTEVSSAPATSAHTNKASAPTTAASHFPLTIEHQYGTTDIAEPPQRIIALFDDEFVLALGVTPVAMSRNPATESGLSNFIEEAVVPPLPQLLDVSGGIPYEQVADLAPDLIVGGTTAADYEALTAIAPTLPYVTDSNHESWQDRQRTIGLALGRQQEAERVIADLESEISSYAEAHSDLAGKSYSLSVVIDAGVISTFRDPAEAGNKLLESLGLELADSVRALESSDLSGRATVGLESLDLLDADLLILSTVAPDLLASVTDSPLFGGLSVHESGRVVILDLPIVFALARPGPYNIPIVLETLLAAFTEPAN